MATAMVSALAAARAGAGRETHCRSWSRWSRLLQISVKYYLYISLRMYVIPPAGWEQGGP